MSQDNADISQKRGLFDCHTLQSIRHCVLCRKKERNSCSWPCTTRCGRCWPKICRTKYKNCAFLVLPCAFLGFRENQINHNFNIINARCDSNFSHIQCVDNESPFQDSSYFNIIDFLKNFILNYIRLRLTCS